MKITITCPKPRNPLVAKVRFRRGGSHLSRNRPTRQQAARALKREMEQMKRSP
jgi:hypothetical protein